jgi:hypothetical protein
MMTPPGDDASLRIRRLGASAYQAHEQAYAALHQHLFRFGGRRRVEMALTVCFLEHNVPQAAASLTRPAGRRMSADDILKGRLGRTAGRRIVEDDADK